jgi:hypothetical protein
VQANEMHVACSNARCLGSCALYLGSGTTARAVSVSQRKELTPELVRQRYLFADGALSPAEVRNVIFVVPGGSEQSNRTSHCRMSFVDK